MFICITYENFSYTYAHTLTFCISFLKNLSFKTFESTMKFWNKNNNSLFCRCIFHEPQKAKWKGTIVHFSFNAQRSFETIMYYNITYWAKIGMYRVYFPPCSRGTFGVASFEKNLKKMILAHWWKQCSLPYIELFFFRF